MPAHENNTGQAERLPVSAQTWTAIIPVYNEKDYILKTLQSLATQTLKGARIIVVDNGSTDGSPGLVKNFAVSHPEARIDLLHEAEPGQAAAMKKGNNAAASDFIAICDADTIYPDFYLERASQMFDTADERTVAALAFSVPSSGDKFARLKGRIASLLMPRQCHTGGYAQTFRASALKMAGGYDRALWPYCLKDHELMHRVSKLGAIKYDYNFWCLPSDRRGDRTNVRWTLFERIIYHVSPFSKKDWFFYEFLKPRFEARGLSELKLRARDWEE